MQQPILLEPCPAMYYKSLSKASGGLGGSNTLQKENSIEKGNENLMDQQCNQGRNEPLKREKKLDIHKYVHSCILVIIAK